MIAGLDIVDAGALAVLWLMYLALIHWVVARWRIPRFWLWLLFTLVVLLVERVSQEAEAWVRMVVLCSTMLVLMKGIVYAEWHRHGGRQLSVYRWWFFALFWLGMEPSAWAGRRRQLVWKHDAWIGVGCFFSGIGLCLMWVHFQITSLPLVFIAMSLWFHFGVLRLLTAFWRFCGFPVRPLFLDPMKAKSLADFWSKRWNVGFSQMLIHAVQRPLTPVVGKKWAMLAVFIVSGLLHEIAITFPVKAGYGLPTVYFVLHGCLAMIRTEKWPPWLIKLFMFACILLPLPLVFPKAFTQEVILLCLAELGRWISP